MQSPPLFLLSSIPHSASIKSQFHPGLAGDNPTLHSDRIKLWHDFNHAWLALFQKQKDMMESGLPQRGQTLVTEEGLKKMGKEIIRLCDGIERHGLVDYEYGVWEEPIIASE